MNTSKEPLFQDSDEACQHDRNLFIDLFSRLGTNAAQEVVLRYILTSSESEQEIERVLFHFSALKEPVKVD